MCMCVCVCVRVCVCVCVCVCEVNKRKCSFKRIEVFSISYHEITNVCIRVMLGGVTYLTANSYDLHTH